VGRGYDLLPRQPSSRRMLPHATPTRPRLTFLSAWSGEPASRQRAARHRQQFRRGVVSRRAAPSSRGVVIHSSDVSRKVERSLVRVAGGIHAPQPVMAAKLLTAVRS
jgi:hypothetical protein